MATSRTPLYEPEEVTAREGSALAQADDVVGAPPEADTVASRALMIAALWERSRLESSKDLTRLTQLTKWVERFGLYGNLGHAGAELFDAELGTWTDEDIDTVSWASEELQVLLWALTRAEIPPVDQRPDPQELIITLPLLKDAEGFLEQSVLRPADEIEATRALYEALLEAVRSEVYARSILEDPAALEPDDELDEMLEAITDRGFDRAAAAKGGKPAEAVQGLRFWSRSLLTELFGDASPHLAQKIDSAKLVSLDDASLAMVLGTAQARAEALAWLVEGDEEVGAPPEE
ncbi:MAG: DUF4272 domain-containing protein [Archangium sp.]|nr:DUF4272 domain-containing protein [Archangium sp.]